MTSSGPQSHLILRCDCGQNRTPKSDQNRTPKPDQNSDKSDKKKGPSYLLTKKDITLKGAMEKKCDFKRPNAL